MKPGSRSGTLVSRRGDRMPPPTTEREYRASNAGNRHHRIRLPERLGGAIHTAQTRCEQPSGSHEHNVRSDEHNVRSDTQSSVAIQSAPSDRLARSDWFTSASPRQSATRAIRRLSNRA